MSQRTPCGRGLRGRTVGVGGAGPVGGRGGRGGGHGDPSPPQNTVRAGEPVRSGGRPDAGDDRGAGAGAGAGRCGCRPGSTRAPGRNRSVATPGARPVLVGTARLASVNWHEPGAAELAGALSAMGIDMEAGTCPVSRMAARLGPATRIGLEDTLLLPGGERALSNAQLVAEGRASTVVLSPDRQAAVVRALSPAGLRGPPAADVNPPGAGRRRRPGWTAHRCPVTDSHSRCSR